MTTRDLTAIALFAALTAALAIVPPITIPVLAVPITAQTLGVMLAGSILGAKRGALSMLLLLALVAVGLPVLAGGRGGLSVFAGPTAGFLVAWPLGAFVIGLLTERVYARLGHVSSFLINLLGGVVVIYALGIAWLVAGFGVAPATAIAGSAAFIPGDLIKAGIAAIVALRVRRAYPMIARA